MILPSKAVRASYGKACRVALIDSAARWCINLPTLKARRDFIAKQPEATRDELKQRIKELWNQT